MAKRKSSMRMWGYLPAASFQKAPLLEPTRVPKHCLQEEVGSVCSGGCGFALAITESGKVVMWGSTNDLGQSHISREGQQEGLEPYLLDLNERIVQAAGGWAHSVAVTDKGDVCPWGWSACAPAASPTTEQRARLIPTSNCQSDGHGTPLSASHERKSECSTQSESQEALKPGAFRDYLSSGNKIGATTTHKRTSSKGPFRFDKIADSLKQSVLDMAEVPSDYNTTAMDDNVISRPWLVSLAAGVSITSVAAGGRHTLALSDTGQVWGWGYGEEGQLGLGSRVGLMPTPQLIQCLEAPLLNSNGSSIQKESSNVSVAILGNRVTRIACGGRHSAVLTDSGAVMSFGWGLYGQCGQGSTEDQLSPVHVSALGGIKVARLAAGLWHTAFVTDEGDVYTNGGNQFGQLGTLGDQAEMLPTLVDAPLLENECAVSVSCGARHTAILTDKGKLFCWGWNKYGQLGTGDSVDRDTPVEVPLDNAVASSLACGWWHTLALIEED
ncbi:unnamed protein product [Calypogeia fissa]